MTTQGIGEHRDAHGVIDLTIGTPPATVTVEAVTRFMVSVGTIGGGVEPAQVSLERLVLVDLVDVQQAQEVLFVEVFEVGVVVLEGQVLGSFPVTAGVEELVAVLACAVDAHAGVVARRTAALLLKLAACEGQVVDILGGDGATLEELRCNPAVVTHQNWQVGCQSITQLQLGLGDFDLGSTAQAAECIVGILRATREEAVVSSVLIVTAQVERLETGNVKTETNGALGVAGDKVPTQNGGQLALICTAFTWIVFVKESPRTDRRFAVLKKTCCTRLLCQYAYSDGQGHTRLTHVLLLEIAIFCF